MNTVGSTLNRLGFYSRPGVDPGGVGVVCAVRWRAKKARQEWTPENGQQGMRKWRECLGAFLRNWTKEMAGKRVE
jgi:hypothetical protein